LTLHWDALIKLVLPSLHVRLESPNALWRLVRFYQKAVLEARGLYPIIFGQPKKVLLWTLQKSPSLSERGSLSLQTDEGGYLLGSRRVLRRAKNLVQREKRRFPAAVRAKRHHLLLSGRRSPDESSPQSIS